MIELAGGLWLASAVVLAFLGRRTGGRALDFFFMSLILTPVTAIIALAAMRQKDPEPPLPSDEG